jgi:hypothetical protein
MSKISVEKLSQEKLTSLKITEWAIWECGISSFDWAYVDQERCYFLEGEVVVDTDTESVKIAAGDFVTFPKGLKCKWNISKPVKKHYKFGT